MYIYIYHDPPMIYLAHVCIGSCNERGTQDTCELYYKSNRNVYMVSVCDVHYFKEQCGHHEPTRHHKAIVDGCEILHHQKDGWNPIDNGMFSIYQLVQDFATIHPMLRDCARKQAYEVFAEICNTSPAVGLWASRLVDDMWVQDVEDEWWWRRRRRRRRRRRQKRVEE